MTSTELFIVLIQLANHPCAQQTGLALKLSNLKNLLRCFLLAGYIAVVVVVPMLNQVVLTHENVCMVLVFAILPSYNYYIQCASQLPFPFLLLLLVIPKSQKVV